MVKLLIAALTALFFLGLTDANAQALVIDQVDPGPYTPGSTITALFSISPEACIGVNNTFELYLSDASGDFSSASEKRIGSFTGFYNTFVNGIIPSGTPAGAGYRLRIKTTEGAAFTSAPSLPFVIRPGSPVTAKLSSNLLSPAGSTDLFGFCDGRANFAFNLKNESTPGSLVNAHIKNEFSNATAADIVFDTEDKTFNAAQTHYTIFVKALNADGSVATKAYMIVNNRALTAFGTTGNNTVCLPNAILEFNVIVSGNDGLENNYPGNFYRVSWGDGKTDVYTICDIKKSGEKIRHEYLETSCGKRIISGGITTNNAFGITIQSGSAYCNGVGTPLSTIAKVINKPKNDFRLPDGACLNTDAVFVNTSIAGEDPTSNNVDCVENSVTYSWYIDGVLVPGAVNKPKSFNLTYKFTTPGMHQIKLVSTSSGPCPAEDFEKSICVQVPPKPSFVLNGTVGTTMCRADVLKPQNTSVVDQGCGIANYNWTITGGPFSFLNSSATSFEPEIKFGGTGIYKVQLSIKSPGCGSVFAEEQTVVVNENPTAVLSADKVLCNRTAYDFNPTTTGPTKTQLTGTSVPSEETYTWSVTGGTFDFINNTDEHTQYPTIDFKEYGIYTIKVVHKNSCGVAATDTQILEFRESPVVNAGQYAAICHNDAITLQGVVTGSFTTLSWVGGSGTFSPNRTTLNAIYTPSAAERAARVVNLSLVVQTELSAPCNEIPGFTTIAIRPANAITSAAALNLCTANLLSYSPTASIAGSTFSWTATGTANVSGFSNSTGDLIADRLINTSSTVGRVTYTIIPTADGCAGTPFSLVVTVNPNPVVTATPISATLCSGERTAIQLSANLANAKFVWQSSSSDVALTGNSQQTEDGNGLSSINDILVNTSNSAQTVTYKVYAISDNGCPGDPITVQVTVNPQGTVANAGPDDDICSPVTYALKGNEPVIGTGRWTVTQGTGVVFDNPNQYNTGITGLQRGVTYILKWTITTPSNCVTADEVRLRFLAVVENVNISTSDPVVCSGRPILISGDLPRGGDGTYLYTWESSTDDGNNWTVIPGENGKDLNQVLTSTTSFRRSVTSSTCSVTGNVVKIATLPPITGNVIVDNQQICAGNAPALITGNSPSGGDGSFLYQWQQRSDNGTTWTDIPGAKAMNYQPGLLTVTTIFRRLVSSANCDGALSSVSNVVTITVKPNAKAFFTVNADNGCAPFRIDADNIKVTPFPEGNGTYTWYAGNVEIGTGAVFPGYTIQGDDASVTIRLVVTSSQGCNPAEMSHTFTTFKNVQAAFTMDKVEGCGPLVVRFTNTSAVKSGVSFSWDFGNSQTSSIADPGAITFLPDPSGKDKIYTVTLNAKTTCGNSVPVTANILVRTTPVSVFSPNKTTGCSPFLVDFSNTSPESSNTTYTFDYGDGSAPRVVTNRNPIAHTFLTGNVFKTYVVKMTAKNACGEHTSEHTITVAPNTVIAELVVNSTDSKGCVPLVVPFSNNSSGADSFVYDFGDGSSLTTAIAPEKVKHTFTRPGIFTVTLTASNGCSVNSTTETITVLPQPEPSFSYDIKMPYPGLKINFSNTSVGGLSYEWDFGDGAKSSEENPSHSFSEIGSYTVSLRATNLNGCVKVFTAKIEVTGEPGSLFLPNSFLPTGDQSEFRTFTPKGTGIKSWHMVVYDKWGETLWETTKLLDGKPADGWDGMYKGTLMPQGIYFWKIDLELINGNKWKGVTFKNSAPKRAGSFYLIR